MRSRPRSRRLGLAALGCVALVLRFACVCAAASDSAISQATDPYVAAATATGVPLELLVAVAGTESGFHPWALNVNGRPQYCRSREQAQRILAITDNVDIGLMQINWPFWGSRLGVSKSALLDPRLNLLYGARILKQPLMHRGDLWHGIGAYHAGTLRTRDRYNQKVYSVYLAYLQGRIK
jgi:soluble lytic murein transglycosylase-like protein